MPQNQAGDPDDLACFSCENRQRWLGVAHDIADQFDGLSRFGFSFIGTTVVGGATAVVAGTFFLSSNDDELLEAKNETNPHMGTCRAPVMFEDLSTADVKMSCHEPQDAVIYWTDDGSDPRSSASRHRYRRDLEPDNPFEDVDRPVIRLDAASKYAIKAVAVANCWDESEVTTKDIVVHKCAPPTIREPEHTANATGTALPQNNLAIVDNNNAKRKAQLVWLDDGSNTQWMAFDPNSTVLVDPAVAGTTRIRTRAIVSRNPDHEAASELLGATLGRAGEPGAIQQAETVLGSASEHWLDSDVVSKVFTVTECTQPHLTYNPDSGDVDVSNINEGTVLQYWIRRRGDEHGTQGVVLPPQTSIKLPQPQIVDGVDDFTVRAWAKQQGWPSLKSPVVSLRLMIDAEQLAVPEISIDGFSDGTVLKRSTVIKLVAKGPFVYSIQESATGAPAAESALALPVEWTQSAGTTSVEFTPQPNTVRVDVYAKKLAELEEPPDLPLAGYDAQHITLLQDSKVTTSTLFTCAPVSFTPHPENRTLALSCETAGATIVWWPGYNPDKRTRYSGPVGITDERDVQAMAFAPRLIPSNVAEVRLDEKDFPPLAPEPAATRCSTPLILGWFDDWMPPAPTQTRRPTVIEPAHQKILREKLTAIWVRIAIHTPDHCCQTTSRAPALARRCLRCWHRGRLCRWPRH